VDSLATCNVKEVSSLESDQANVGVTDEAVDPFAGEVSVKAVGPAGDCPPPPPPPHPAIRNNPANNSPFKKRKTSFFIGPPKKADFIFIIL
jgi:hypothetical protein